MKDNKVSCNEHSRILVAKYAIKGVHTYSLRLALSLYDICSCSLVPKPVAFDTRLS